MNIVIMPDASIKKTSKLLDIQAKAGFNNLMLDMSVFAPEQILEQREQYKEKGIDNVAVDIAFEPFRLEAIANIYLKKCKTLGFKHSIGRAPSLAVNSKRKDMEEILYQLTEMSIRICAGAGCQYIIIEPLTKAPKTEQERNRNIKFYLYFAKLAAENNMMVLIRNNYCNYNGNLIRSMFSDARKINELVELLNQESGGENYGVCLDVGVCNICGQNMYEIISDLGSKIKAVIMRENDGITDNSLLPFSCVNKSTSRLDWLNLIRGLRKIDFNGELIYDFRDSLYAVSHLLRQDIVEYAKKVLDFLVWQIMQERTIKKYEKRVLFGAGNMCRNYMKCYGEQFPPLFTCDNNKCLWGSNFEGIKIKSPEELLSLPSDVAIFICNMFYDEIEQQLAEMGVKNPIERFNDEYMPSTYTNRFNAEKREIN